MSPLVTCVMLTTHPRRAVYLPDALRAFRQQTYMARELVVVNDGAPLVAHTPDIRVVNLPQRNTRWTIGEKRNVGIRAARGEFIATWDDDDLSLPHRLAKQMEAVLAWNADVVLADRMLVADEKLRIVGDCERLGRPVQPSALMNRSAMVYAGGYPAVDVFEDQSLVERIRYLVRGNVAVLTGSDWYVIRRHASNITQAYNDGYAVCAMQDTDIAQQQAVVDAVLAGPGGTDVTDRSERTLGESSRG